jgi:hypothetical protein
MGYIGDDGSIGFDAMSYHLSATETYFFLDRIHEI